MVSQETTPADDQQKSLKDVIDELTTALETQEEKKKEYERNKGRLLAVQKLDGEFEEVKKAYEAAHRQLEIDQDDYENYFHSAKVDLEEQLKEAAPEVKEKSEQRDADLVKQEQDIEALKDELKAAEGKRAGLEDARKAAAEFVASRKQLKTVITAEHAKIKSVRDDVTKARQAGDYFLAYGLLMRKAYQEAVENAAQNLYEPKDLEVKLVAAVRVHADAETDYAENESLIASTRLKLTEAEKKLAADRTKGEAQFREDLKKMLPKDAAAPDGPTAPPDDPPAAGGSSIGATEEKE